MKKILAGLLLIAPLTANADNWLCIVDKSTGFKLENGTWEIGNFNPDKYLIKPADKVSSSAGALYQVNSFGSELPEYICPTGFEDGEYKGILDCRGFAIRGDTFKFNLTTGHFLSTYTSGYVHTSKGKIVDDNPAIQIGKCSKL